MADSSDPRDVAAAWRPQFPGRVGPRDIRDAIVEPDWAGLRVVAALGSHGAEVYRYGDRIDVPRELERALAAAFDAVDAVIEGHLTTAAFEDGVGAYPAAEPVGRPIFSLPRFFRGSAKEDPYVFGRIHQAKSESDAPGILDALAAGERHAFVAVDLLWLDGQALDDVPLLERKRLLDTVLAPSLLVRVTPFVRPVSAQRTLITWGTLGFGALSWRAANGRYLAGRENPDWAIAPTPRTGTSLPKATEPSR